MKQSVKNFSPASRGFHFSNQNFPQVPCVIKLFGKNLSLGNAGNGLCGGMVFAVRDYFQSGTQIPETRITPCSGSLFNYLCQRQLDSFNLPSGILKYYQHMNPWYRQSLQGLNRQCQQVCRDIEHNLPAPLSLIQIKAWHPAALIANHQVLAYGYDLTQELLTLNIYDPNFPDNEELSISLRLCNPISEPLTYYPSTNANPLYGIFYTTFKPTTPPEGSR